MWHHQGQIQKKKTVTLLRQIPLPYSSLFALFILLHSFLIFFIFLQVFFYYFMILINLFIYVFLKILFIYFYREGKGGRKRGRETTKCGCLLHAPCWGPGLQPRLMPWLGIEPRILWFTGWCSIYWATPARAISLFLNFSLFQISYFTPPFSYSIFPSSFLFKNVCFKLYCPPLCNLFLTHSYYFSSL